MRIAETERPLTTKLDDVDKKLFGGLVRKQLMVISGPSGGGKSVMMNNLSLNYAETGHHVLFISLELSQDLNYLRYASMMSGLGLNGWFTNIDGIAERVERYQSILGLGQKGTLFIKRLPMGSKPSHIRAVVKEYELLHGQPPDVCIVDYVDIMGSDVKVSAENISLKDKYATEGLREVMNDFNMIGITGSQIQKSAQDQVDIDASQTAGGQTKLNTVDVWGNIMLTEEMKQAGVIGIKWLKTRTSDGKGKVSLMKYDPVSLRVTNFDVPPTESEMKQYLSLTKKAAKKTEREVEILMDSPSDRPSGHQEPQDKMKGLLQSMLVLDGDNA
jgi:hypothetical protein